MNPIPLSTVTDPPMTLTGALIAAVTVLAGVIVYLFIHFSKQAKMERKAFQEERKREDEAYAKGRQEWAVERVRLEMAAKEVRSEYETRHRELMERHAEAIRQLYDDAREAESAARREYAQNMEVVAQKAAEAQEKVGHVLDKIYNRFIGTRSRSH